MKDEKKEEGNSCLIFSNELNKHILFCVKNLQYQQIKKLFYKLVNTANLVTLTARHFKLV